MQIDQPLDNTIQHLQKYVFREYVLGEIVDKRTVGVILGDDPILELILMKMSLGAYKIHYIFVPQFVRDKQIMFILPHICVVLVYNFDGDRALIVGPSPYHAEWTLVYFLQH
jgi:hypothetical protein